MLTSADCFVDRVCRHGCRNVDMDAEMCSGVVLEEVLPSRSILCKRECVNTEIVPA